MFFVVLPVQTLNVTTLPVSQMSTIQKGDYIPEDATFLILKDDAPTPVGKAELFNNKKVVLFGVPGAFTPGCSKAQCPSFVLAAARLKQKGIDEVYCTAVNDCFVLDAWAREQGAAGKVTMLADGDGSFARKVGLTRDTGAFGGVRSARYAMVVNNGVVEHLAIDEPFTEVKVTTADALLEHI